MPGVRSTLPWRGVIIALLPALAAGSAVRTAPAQSTQAGPVPMLYRITLHAGGNNFEVCEGKTLTIPTQVIVSQARRPPTGRPPRWQNTYPSNVRVRGAVGNSSVGTLSPSTVRTGASGIFAGAGLAEFTFTARRSGTTTITFDLYAESMSLPPGFTGHITVQPTEVVQVEVKSCRWNVMVVGHWEMRAGFRPSATSTFETQLDIAPIFEGQPVEVTAEVTNGATGVVRGCTPRFEVPKSTVDLRVELARGSNTTVLLSLFYDPWTASTIVTCPGAGQGMAQDRTFMPAPLLNLRFPDSGGAQTRRHDLVTRPTNLIGRSTIIVTEIP